MDSTHPICRTCGMQYEHGHDSRHCSICDDERQYVPSDGQQWTNLTELREAGHRSLLRQDSPSVSAPCWYPAMAETCYGTA